MIPITFLPLVLTHSAPDTPAFSLFFQQVRPVPAQGLGLALGSAWRYFLSDISMVLSLFSDFYSSTTLSMKSLRTALSKLITLDTCCLALWL